MAMHFKEAIDALLGKNESNTSEDNTSNTADTVPQAPEKLNSVIDNIIGTPPKEETTESKVEEKPIETNNAFNFENFDVENVEHFNQLPEPVKDMLSSASTILSQYEEQIIPYLKQAEEAVNFSQWLNSSLSEGDIAPIHLILDKMLGGKYGLFDKTTNREVLFDTNEYIKNKETKQQEFNKDTKLKEQEQQLNAIKAQEEAKNFLSIVDTNIKEKLGDNYSEANDKLIKQKLVDYYNAAEKNNEEIPDRLIPLILDSAINELTKQNKLIVNKKETNYSKSLPKFETENKNKPRNKMQEAIDQIING